MSTQSEHVSEEEKKRKDTEKQVKQVALQTVRQYLPQYLKADDAGRKTLVRFVHASLQKDYPDLELKTISSQFSISAARQSIGQQAEPKILIEDTVPQAPAVVPPTPPVVTFTTPIITAQQLPNAAQTVKPISSVEELAKWQDGIMKHIDAKTALLEQQAKENTDAAVAKERDRSLATMANIENMYKDKIKELEAKIPQPRRGRPPKQPEENTPVQFEDDGEDYGEDEQEQAVQSTGPPIRYTTGNETHTIMETGAVRPFADAIAKVVATDPYRIVLFNAWKVKKGYTKDFAHFLLDAVDEFFALRNVDLAYTERIRKKGNEIPPELVLEETARRQLLRNQFPNDGEE